MIDKEIDKNYRRTNPDLPFSLSCHACDAGTEIMSFEQAVLEGWTGIEEEVDGLSYNHVGLCPECRAEEEVEQHGSC